jgi:hypothetical protein
VAKARTTRSSRLKTTGTTDTAVATESDLDADNIADALKWDLGLDGNNADSDADGVADGDEINIYGTEPPGLGQ